MVMRFYNNIPSLDGPQDQTKERVKDDEASHLGGLDGGSQSIAEAVERCAGHPEAESAHSSKIYTVLIHDLDEDDYFGPSCWDGTIKFVTKEEAEKILEIEKQQLDEKYYTAMISKLLEEVEF